MALQGVPEHERQERSQKIREASRARIRQILTPEQQGRYDEMVRSLGEGRAGTSTGRVWVVGPDGKPLAITLTLGISDGATTEVVRGDLKDGQEVIVGLSGQTGAPGRPGGGGPRLRL
jgi:HlyD family secretion protein